MIVQETYHQLPSLERLNLLLGEWNLEFIFPLHPDHHLHEREDFEWMKDRTFLFERWHSRSLRIKFHRLMIVFGALATAKFNKS